MKIRYILKILCILLSTPLYAADKGPAMVNGAGPLEKGRLALSLDLGFNLPEPIFYGARLDYGALKRWQTGLAFTGVPIPEHSIISVGFINKVNLWKSHKEDNFFSVLGDINYLTSSHLIAEGGVLDLEWGIAYEHRFGENKNTGLYAKLIAAHARVLFEGDFFDNPVDNEWVQRLLFGGGIQHQFGRHFSLALELFGNYTFDSASMISIPFGKIGLTWAF